MKHKTLKATAFDELGRPTPNFPLRYFYGQDHEGNPLLYLASEDAIGLLNHYAERIGRVDDDTKEMFDLISAVVGGIAKQLQTLHTQAVKRKKG